MLMKRVERLAWLSVAVVACNGVLWTSVAGCGPDNPNTDAGPDSMADTKTDGPTIDAPNDVSDGGSKDVAIDVKDLVDFQHNFATTYCQRIAKECWGAQFDAAAPDAAVAACADTIVTSGGGLENAVYDLADPNALNGGHIHLNTTASASCLAGLSTMTLPAIPGTEYATLAQNCTGALTGDLANGQGCHETAECTTGFCSYAADAGAPDGSPGACIATGATNAPCGSGRGAGNEECMHRSWNGTTQLRCDLTESDGGPGTKVCTVKKANNSDCFYEWDCTTNTCDDNYKCNTSTTAWTYAYPGFCPAVFGPDSGLQ